MLNSLGERLKYLRKSRNLTQAELAENIEISRANISKIEKDEISPLAKNLVHICTFFDVSADWLLMGEGDMDKNTIEDAHLDENEHEDETKHEPSNPTSREDEFFEEYINAYESVILKPDETEMIECYKRLERIDQARILERIKTILEIKGEKSASDSSKRVLQKRSSEKEPTKEAKIV